MEKKTSEEGKVRMKRAPDAYLFFFFFPVDFPPFFLGNSTGESNSFCNSKSIRAN